MVKNAGANWVLGALKLLLVCCAAVTWTWTVPAVASSGATTFIGVGLMYSTYAAAPLMVTDTPCREVGSSPFTKSLACHVYVDCDRFVPKMDTQVPAVKPGRKLAAFSTPVIAPAGCVPLTNSVTETAAGLPVEPAAAICTLPV